MQVTTRLRTLLQSTSEPSSPLPIIGQFLLYPNADTKTLSQELTALYREFSHGHTAFFIACVFALRAELPATGDGSIIQEWWDMLLKPALRDPQLPEESKDQARSIVARALDADETEHRELIVKFQKRLVELWVYELPNDIEACGMDETELSKVRCWSANLSQILLRFGHEKPKEFFDTICVESPKADSQQLQALLLAFVIHDNFTSSDILLKHALFDALKTHATAAPVISTLIACLAHQHPDLLQHELLPVLLEALLHSLSAGHDAAVTSRPVFSILYYLFPCTTIEYLKTHGAAIQDTVSDLVKSHTLHPHLLWSSATIEVAAPKQVWNSYDIAQIISESAMLALSRTQVESLPPSPRFVHPLHDEKLTDDHVREGQHSRDTVDTLQKQIYSLRNELSLAQWHQTHNRKHILRMYEHNSSHRHSEHDWQSIKGEIRLLREQRKSDAAQIKSLTDTMERQKQHSKELQETLQAKNMSLKKSEKGWDTKRAELEAANEQQKQEFDAQAKLLSEAMEEVWQLKTQRREVQHKIDRLHDYEAQIERDHKMQLTWAEDFERFKAREDQLADLKLRCEQMHMMQTSTEQAQLQLQESSRQNEMELSNTKDRLKEADRKLAQMADFQTKIASASAAQNDQTKALRKRVTELSEAKNELEDHLTELRAEIEILRNRRGLVRSDDSGSAYRAVIV